MRADQFPPTVAVTKVLPVPKGLVQFWNKDFVTAVGLRLLDNQGGGYCGHYALGQIENALFGRKAVSPRTVVRRLHTLAARYTQGDPHRRKRYLGLPPHWLEDFELSWYLDWLQVNWVLVHYHHGPHKKHLYSVEVQGRPDRDRWVFLFNQGQGHWMVVTPSNGRGRTRDFPVIFSPEQARHMVEHLGAHLPVEDSRVMMAPSARSDDYHFISKKSSKTHHTHQLDADSDSDATFPDDPYA